MNKQLLHKIPLFKDLPDEEIDLLADTLQVVELPPNTILFREGDPGDRFYIVIYGQLETIKALGTKEEWILGLRGPGEFIGELSLINRSGLRTASVRSVNEVTLWEMTHASFDALLLRQPRMAFEIVRVLSSRLLEAENASIEDLRQKNIQLERAYNELKKAQAQIIEKERLERELQIAYQIQMSILPHELPQLKGYDFGACIVPARTVGGDFYGIVRLSSQRIGVFIGDVSDKGVPSAIFMARTHAILHAEASRGVPPDEVLKRVNHQLVNFSHTPLFVTVLYGIIDRRKDEFHYARAGHELPIIVDCQGLVALGSWDQGQLLGVLPEPTIDVQTIHIPQGSTIVLYTDGLFDGRNDTGEPYGMERIKQGLAELCGKPAQEVCTQLLSSLTTYQDGAPQDDDITIVAIHSEAGPT
jgi:sigma-B regulation protein RsbU (phosphoserine phosphatase)